MRTKPFHRIFLTIAVATSSLSLPAQDQPDKIDSLLVTIDSLRPLKLPTDRYILKLDSIGRTLKQRAAMRLKPDPLRLRADTLRMRADTLKMKGKSRLDRAGQTSDSLGLELERRRAAIQERIFRKTSFLDSLNVGSGPLGFSQSAANPLSQLNTQLPGLGNSVPSLPEGTGNHLEGVGKDLKVQDAKMPDLKIDNPLKGIDNPLQDLNKKVDEIQSMPQKAIQGSDIGKGVADVKGKIQQVNEVAQKAEAYKEDIKNVAEGNMEKVKALPQEIEKAALKIDEVKELQAQDQKVTATKNMLQQYQDMVKSMHDKEAVKEVAKDAAMKEMPDPFAGQEEKLKAGIAKLDELKKKYKTIPDSRYLPKRVPNEMKGRPFRERIVPGAGFQLYKTGNLVADMSPYIAYKLSGRFRPGVGAAYRIGFFDKKPFVVDEEVFGCRVFNDFRWYGTFYLHTEAEWLHFSEAALAKYKLPVDHDMRLWKFRTNVGLFRTYKISRRLEGQVQLLYNVMDMRRFPQARQTSLRFGVEFKFKPRKG